MGVYKKKPPEPQYSYYMNPDPEDRPYTGFDFFMMCVVCPPVLVIGFLAGLADKVKDTALYALHYRSNTRAR